MQIRPTDSTVQDFQQKHFVQVFNFFQFQRRNSTTAQDLLTVRSVFSDCKPTKKTPITESGTLMFFYPIKQNSADALLQVAAEGVLPNTALWEYWNCWAMLLVCAAFNRNIFSLLLSSYSFSLPSLSPFLSFAKRI